MATTRKVTRRTTRAKKAAPVKAELEKAAEHTGRAMGLQVKSRVMGRQETGERLGRLIADELIAATSLVAERIATAQMEGDHFAVEQLGKVNAALWRMRWELGIMPEHERATAEQGRKLATVNEYVPEGAS